MEDRESGEPCHGFCDVVFRCPPVLSPPSFSGSWYVQLMALQSGHVSHGKKSPHLQSHSLPTMSSNKSSGYLVHMGGNHGVPLFPNMSIVIQGLCLKYFPGLYSCITQTPSLFRHSERKPFPYLFQLSEVIFIHWLYPFFLSFKTATMAQMFFLYGFWLFCFHPAYIMTSVIPMVHLCNQVDLLKI